MGHKAVDLGCPGSHVQLCATAATFVCCVQVVPLLAALRGCTASGSAQVNDAAALLCAWGERCFRCARGCAARVSCVAAARCIDTACCCCVQLLAVGARSNMPGLQGLAQHWFCCLSCNLVSGLAGGVLSPVSVVLGEPCAPCGWRRAVQPHTHCDKCLRGSRM
jgi:hypothetical protein